MIHMEKYDDWKNFMEKKSAAPRPPDSLMRVREDSFQFYDICEFQGNRRMAVVAFKKNFTKVFCLHIECGWYFLVNS